MVSIEAYVSVFDDFPRGSLVFSSCILGLKCTEENKVSENLLKRTCYSWKAQARGHQEINAA